ncbi:MAG: hypothetical protein NT131_06260 [Methanomassiliicoccales archaeon]|nr:hypothetical protein [Methanomassiliicoccales archaeon]
MRTLKVLSLVLVGMFLISVLALFAAPAMADGNGSGNGNGNGNGPWSEGGGETPANNGNNDNNKMYQKGADRSLMGKMQYSHGQGQGGFVFYEINETTGVITDYGLITSEGEKVLLTSISVEGFVPEDIDVHGSIAKLIDGETVAVVHDNPTGMYHLFVNESANMTIVLSGDMTVIENKVMNEPCNMTYQLVISDGNSTGVIASDDPFEVTENGTVVSCNVTEHLMIRFLPQVAHRHQWMEMVLMQAVQNGQVAAEITIVADDESGIYDTVSYRNELQVQVQSVVKNKFQLSAQGQNGQGALLLINTETGTMDMSQDHLHVRLNGTDMQQVDDPLELIYGQPDQACYAVVDNGEVQQLLVYLPAESLGTVTVEGTDALSALLSPIGLVMVIGAVGLVAFKKR